MCTEILTRPELTANINPPDHGLYQKMQTLIPANINEFTVDGGPDEYKVHNWPVH